MLWEYPSAYGLIHMLEYFGDFTDLTWHTIANLLKNIGWVSARMMTKHRTMTYVITLFRSEPLKNLSLFGLHQNDYILINSFSIRLFSLHTPRYMIVPHQINVWQYLALFIFTSKWLYLHQFFSDYIKLTWYSKIYDCPTIR